MSGCVATDRRGQAMTDTEHGPAAGVWPRELAVDPAAVAGLDEALASAGAHLSRLITDAGIALDAVDAAIGIDVAAQAFRAGFSLRNHAIRASAETALAHLEDHRARLRRGARVVGEADHDVALRLSGGDR